MSWGEALRLLGVLRRDTSSQFAAALEGWEFPVDRNYLATLDLFDLTMAANNGSKTRPAPHPGRPFKSDRRDIKRYGDTGGRSYAEVARILNAMGHSLPV